MGKYKDSDWYINSSKVLIQKYNDIPPPWIYAPNFHPFSMGWRMGGGESHMMILHEWLDQEDLNFNDRVEYLKKYPAPARWYLWIIRFLWNVDAYKLERNEYLPYFEKLQQLGLYNSADFIKDFNRNDLD